MEPFLLTGKVILYVNNNNNNIHIYSAFLLVIQSALQSELDL